jgi:AcrR family transcriptional regulator
MSRIVKPAAERKAELVDCAVALFFEKGYEATTIADIIDRTRLSKGAFYHHFSAKEDLLDAFTERLADSMLTAAQDVLKDESLNEVARFSRFLEQTSRFQFDSEPAPVTALEALLKPQNVVLYQRVQSVIARSVTPILAKIIARGIERHEFDVPDAELAAEMVVQLANGRYAMTVEAVGLARSGKIKAATELLEHRLKVEQLFLDRLLGVPPGSIQVFPANYVKVIVTTIAGATRRKARG